MNKLTDNQLITQQKTLLKICSFCEYGLRIGVNTPKFAELSRRTHEELIRVETEYFVRHPGEQEKRQQAFLRSCESIFDSHNRDSLGIDSKSAGEEIFTEYNTPRPGMKLVTLRHLDESGNPSSEKTNLQLPMESADAFFAELENAMDEYAKTLPDKP